MILAGGHRADGALTSEPEVLKGNLSGSIEDLLGKTSPPLPFHLLAQRFSQQFQPREIIYQNRPPSSSETVRPSIARPQNIKRKPKHVPIVISQAVISSVLNNLPPSPTSLNLTPGSSPIIRQEHSKTGTLQAQSSPRPRHIPIIIPDFAQPHGRFPPTPSTSAESTPRASLKPHSCELLYSAMSRPNTSGSRTSTIDSHASGSSPNPVYTSRFKPSSSTYLADMNSSSESSLNQPNLDFRSPNVGSASRTMNMVEMAHSSTDDSPNAGQSSHSASAATTNLSGLVCNVHKCTGREPLARVGATTTVLGDKLYVFGGRTLSKKHSRVTSDMFELDLIRRHWARVETSGAIPKPRYFHTVCPLGDHKLICYGGMSPTPPDPNSPQSPPSANSDPMENMVVMSDIHVYDTIKRTWTHIATQETPPGRYAHCAAVVPSSAVFTSSNAPLSAIHHNPPSSVPNQGSLGVALDGSGGAEMIVVGGQDSHNKYIDAISVFNLRSLRWTDTQSLERSCGAYRSVVTPLTSMPASKIGAGVDTEDSADAGGGVERSDGTTSMLIYSNYNFLDVKLELQARLADGSLLEKEMNGPVSPPGLRFPSGDILDNHFIVSGTYLTSSKHEYALWALDLRNLTWSRIDAGGGIFSQGSWNRGILWARRNTFVILGDRKRVLVADYNRRRINFSNICMVELEAFGLYDNPRRVSPTSNYSSISAPILPSHLPGRPTSLGGRPLTNAAMELGLMAMNLRDIADMDLLAINGERIPVNSNVLSRRWGPYFIQLLRESSTLAAVQNDASSSSDGGTLRPSPLNPQSIASRNSSITITPSITTTASGAPSSLTAVSGISNPTTSHLILEAPSPQNLPSSSRPRQLYLPHTVLTIRALVYFFYTSSLPPPNHELCTPQILCSLLQLARPYRVDGLLEATVERLHQILDGRNAAAVFNAAAMAAGGGRGTGTPFGKEGDLDTADELHSGLTITRLNSRGGPGATSDAHSAGGPSESSEDSESLASSSVSASESASEAEVGGRDPRNMRVHSVGAPDEVWSGGVSCVVGLQKRGLRGLMEGRRMRERERGRTVGGLNSTEGPTIVGNSIAVNGHSNHTGGGSGGGVGLGIA